MRWLQLKANLSAIPGVLVGENHATEYIHIVLRAGFLQPASITGCRWLLKALEKTVLSQEEEIHLRW